MTNKVDRMRAWRIAALALGLLSGIAAYASTQDAFQAIFGFLLSYGLVWIIGRIATGLIR